MAHDERSPPVPPDRFYATRVRQLARLDLPEGDARRLWMAVGRHRRELKKRLGRDVGQRVALLDYVLNIGPRVVEPQIVERRTLETLEQQALTDALTGLSNRHYFSSELTREVERCRRYGALTALLLLDLDGFKRVNDIHGHAMGDEVLRRVGRVILKHVRAADIAARLGGDEFAVLLPDTAGTDAAVVAERIRRDVGACFTSARLAGHGLEVSVSVGVVTLDPVTQTPTDFVEAADRRLYAAKRLGGNRVATFTPVPRPVPPEAPGVRQAGQPP